MHGNGKRWRLTRAQRDTLETVEQYAVMAFAVLLLVVWAFGKGVVR